MVIRYLGHACFLLEDGGRALVIDPYDPSTGALPQVSAQVALISHSHHDHSYAQGVEGIETVVDTPGRWSAQGMCGEGLETFHDASCGSVRGKNIVQVIQMDGLRIVHCGDLGHLPEGEVLEKISGCDVLMVPVGGHFTIDARAATELCEAVRPRVVIPMHYNVKARESWPVATVDVFLEGKTNVVRLSTDSVDPKDVNGIVVLAGG